MLEHKVLLHIIFLSVFNAKGNCNGLERKNQFRKRKKTDETF